MISGRCSSQFSQRSAPGAKGRMVRAMLGLGLAVSVFAAPAAALEVAPGEEEALKACEKRVCTMILDKDPKGDDLTCGVQKTWAKSDLEGGESKGVSWGFGDARCSVDLKLSRRDVIAALTQPKHTIRVPAHDVKCAVEREGQLKPVKVRLAPKLTFKKGKADKVWINLEEIDGPADVQATVWTAAQLEDTLGIFHRPMIKSINKFVHRNCARRYGPEAVAKEKAAAEKKAAAAGADKKPAAKKADTAAAAKKAAPQNQAVVPDDDDEASDPKAAASAQ